MARSEPPLIRNVQSPDEPRSLSTGYSGGMGTLSSGCGLAGKSYTLQHWLEVTAAGGALELACESMISSELTLNCQSAADVLIK